MSGLRRGEVVATYGRNSRVEADGRTWYCVLRGRRGEIACGDQVEWRETSSGEGVIEQVLPRRNLLYRSDAYRRKLLAANVDQVLIVVAVEPSFSTDLVSRALVAAESADIPLTALLNKVELAALASARERLAPFIALGVSVVETSLKIEPADAVAQLLPVLAGKTTVVIGQSGMGKSTLVNLLVPDAAADTREVSVKLDSGKHTTTSARIYGGEGFRLVDSPGFQEFGLAHLDLLELQNAFVEFRPLLGGCKFYNCRHHDEPGCAIVAAVARGEIAQDRYELYRQLASERATEVRPH
ncbi:ribosome small subunit-dependent GTPase A [soil metagenome]